MKLNVLIICFSFLVTLFSQGNQICITIDDMLLVTYGRDDPPTPEYIKELSK